MKTQRVYCDEKAEVDLTPMLDVVFILLIFFIVTASFVSETALGLHVPENQPAQKSENNSALIQLNQNNEIFIDGRRVDKRSVASLVAQKLAENRETTFVVRAHELASTESYVAIADAVKKAHGGQAVLVPYTN